MRRAVDVVGDLGGVFLFEQDLLAAVYRLGEEGGDDDGEVWIYGRLDCAVDGGGEVEGAVEGIPSAVDCTEGVVKFKKCSEKASAGHFTNGGKGFILCATLTEFADDGGNDVGGVPRKLEKAEALVYLHGVPLGIVMVLICPAAVVDNQCEVAYDGMVKIIDVWLDVRKILFHRHSIVQEQICRLDGRVTIHRELRLVVEQSAVEGSLVALPCVKCEVGDSRGEHGTLLGRCRYTWLYRFFIS